MDETTETLQAEFAGAVARIDQNEREREVMQSATYSEDGEGEATAVLGGRTCPSCSSSVEDSWRFCMNCGAMLE
jgi:hypothetical protein